MFTSVQTKDIAYTVDYISVTEKGESKTTTRRRYRIPHSTETKRIISHKPQT